MTVLVAGGGVAGAAAACLLGPSALLVERNAAGHHKICGEFVSGEAVAALRSLGVDPADLGAAPISGVRLVRGGAVAESALPFAAAGLSRRLLDAALLQRAKALGAEVVLGETVRRVGEGGAEISGTGFVRGKVLLAVGKHDLRGVRRRVKWVPEDLVGLKMHLRLSPAQAAALAGFVEVLLFPGGYGGLLPVEGGAANLCVLLERRVFQAAGESWAGVQSMLASVSAHCAARLGGAVPLLDRPCAIASVPYGFLHRARPGDPEGVFRLGDQAAVIPSFAGDGMAMALHSAVRAAVSVMRDDDAGTYHGRLRREMRGQMRRAWAIYRAGRAAPGLLALGARAWPGGMRLAARMTRVAR